MCVMARQLREKQQHCQRRVSVPISGYARHMYLKSQSESSTSALMAWCRRLWCYWGKKEKKSALLRLLENAEARHEISNENLALMNAIPTKRDLFELSLELTSIYKLALFFSIFLFAYCEGEVWRVSQVAKGAKMAGMSKDDFMRKEKEAEMRNEKKQDKKDREAVLASLVGLIISTK